MQDEIMKGATEVVQSGAALTQIKGQHQTSIAIQNPRKLSSVKAALSEEAELMGDGAYYQWMIGSGAKAKQILGIGYHGSTCLLRNWKNCSAEIERVELSGRDTILHAAFIDYETNVSIVRTYKVDMVQAVAGIYGNYSQGRKQDMAWQIAQSKALRNVILSGVPKWAQDTLLDSAMNSVREKIEENVNKKGIAFVIQRAVSELNKLGITDDMIKSKFGRKTLEKLDVNDIVIITGDLATLKSGDAFVSELYPVENDTTEKDKLKDNLKKAADKKKAEPEKPKDKLKPETVDDTPPDEMDAAIVEWLEQSEAERGAKYMALKSKVDFPIKLYIENNELIVKDKQGKPSTSFADLSPVQQSEVIVLMCDLLPKKDNKDE